MKRHINIDIEGMHRASCSSLITMALKNRKGIEEVSVNLLAKSTSLIFEDGDIGVNDIIDIISDLGYKAELAGEGVKKSPER